MSKTLPKGFSIRLNREVRVEDDGTALVGGSPTRVLYLTAAARDMFDGPMVRVADRGSEAMAQHLLDAGMADPVLDELPTDSALAVTIVVPARDRPAALDRLLRSIDGDYPVIVVDDCSQDPQAVADVAAAHGVQLVALPVNLGPAGARNAGLQEVTTPLVAFVDSDMVLDADTVPLLLRHFADPRLAMVAPRIMGLMEEHANWIGRYEDARSSLDMGRFPALVRPLSRVSWLPAACMIARVDVLGEGFGGGMRVAEDVDLVWRLAEEGWRVRYEPAVRARHEHRVRLVDWLGRKAFYGTGAALLADRHPRSIAPAVLAPWSIALLGAALAQRWWSLPASLAICAVATTRIASRLPRSRHPMRVSARLVANGAVSALFQGSALLLRHWWPLTVLACAFSSRVRRAAVIGAVVDVAMEYFRTDARLDPLRFALLRRLDDLAYGAGVWFGVLRRRSVTALLPKVNGGRSKGS